MATIALSGTSLNYTMGIGAFQGLGKAFSDAKRTSGGLRDALNTLKSKIDIASVAAKVDTVQEQVQKAQARESEKASSLTLAYEKLDTLICDTGTIDYQVYNKISSREDDFYKCYYYLKPECKKTGKEKASDWWAERWQDLKNIWGGVGNAFANIAKDVVDFCKKYIGIITAIVVIVAAIIVATFLGPAAVAAICSLIAFLCTAADTVALIATGKDIYTLLKDSGHPILAEIFGGVKWGATIAAIVLNFAQLFTEIHKVGLSTFKETLTHGEGFKGFLKTAWEGIKNDFSSIFGKGKTIGQRAKAAWNIIVLNQSADFSFRQSISAYRAGEKIITAVNTVGKDSAGQYVAKSDFAKEALESRGYSTDLIQTKKGLSLFDKSEDYDWFYYGAKEVGKVDVMKMYKEGKIPYKNGKVYNDALRKRVWGKLGYEGPPPDLSLHEFYKIKSGKITVALIDRTLHSKKVFNHNGGISNVANIINSLDAGTFAQKEKRLAIEGLTRIFPDIIWNLGDQFFSWAH
ncbi:MAG: hypothetical protein HDT42_03110 [Ruminococcaceae bacterium]|nr:hypothetical protein [Oscillospiraceae bacterium]